MPNPDGSLTTDDLIDQILGGGDAQQRRQPLLQRFNIGQQMMGAAPTATGQAVGQTYVAASPLQHLSDAITHIVGAKMAGSALHGESDLTNQILGARKAGA